MQMNDNEPADRKVWVGRHVELELKYDNGEKERLGLNVVADAAADFSSGFLGEGTSLARAIMGMQAGSIIPYKMGDIVEVRILSVSAEMTAQPKDLTERRDEVTRKALRQSNHTSAVIYASSMNSKWGDYDPSALKDEDGTDPDKDKS